MRAQATQVDRYSLQSISARSHMMSGSKNHPQLPLVIECPI